MNYLFICILKTFTFYTYCKSSYWPPGGVLSKTFLNHNLKVYFMLKLEIKHGKTMQREM